ncbi:MAG: FG-GAP-like repeat-containing protein [Planctomycetaceae bacterium]
MARLWFGRHRFWLWGLVLVLGMFAVAFQVHTSYQQAQRQQKLSILRKTYDESRYIVALELCRDVLRMSPADADALAIAGLSAGALKQTQAALHWLSQLPATSTSRYVYNGRIANADIHRDLGFVDVATGLLQSMLKADATDVLVIRRLAQIHTGIGNQAEAVSLLNRLVQLGSASPRELMTLAAHADDMWSLERIRRLRVSAPDDRRLVLAEAKHLHRQRRDADALQRLRPALRIHPDDPELLLRRLELDDHAADTELTRLAACEPSARLWLFLAGRAERITHQLATEFAWQAFNVDPFDRAANSCLARLLTQAGQAARAQAFVSRAQRLRELAELCARRDAIGTERAPRAVRLLRQLGRQPEVVAWCRAELRLSPDSAWAVKVLDEVLHDGVTATRDRPAESIERTSETIELTVSQALEKLNQCRDTGQEAWANANGEHAPRDFRFIDVAQQSGLNVEFYNGAEARESSRRMHEVTGGGVGVLDIDHDDWPDLFFPRGSDDPRGVRTHPATTADQLFRNLRGREFEPVSAVAGIKEHEFGQGAGVGDINNDGFDDIYVANIGRNTLWINQGDGTFQRQTHPADAGVWTVSVAIADINGDSIPDLYDANYIGGENVFTLICDHEGRLRICGPMDFPAEQDVLWWGRGDGDFAVQDEALESISADGRGMGVVVGDLLQTGRVQILVANDESANFFLEVDEVGRLTDSARRRGIAFGGNGLAQGSMGIAAGHAAGRQRLDLFITNYYGEANCLHVQTQDGFFPDLIAQRRLELPGRAMLGFGTQFLDADADGDDDLFVANGHLDDFQFLGLPYKMRPQLFENRNAGFSGSSSSSFPWLEMPALGRAVARLDWNRDGRMDLCVTHLDRPAALLENQTTPLRPSVMLSYVGTLQSRDAVGSGLTVTQESSRQRENSESAVFPILAGDGYECSNQRLFHVVLNDNSGETVVSDGLSTVELSVDLTTPELWRIVEGHSRAWRVPE